MVPSQYQVWTMPKSKKSKAKRNSKTKKVAARRGNLQRVGLYLNRRVYAQLRARTKGEGESVTQWFKRQVSRYLGGGA